MAVQKSVFISYRRTDSLWALNIYQFLKARGYDVFYDIHSIRSGDWKQIILENIRARAHFIIVMTPSAAQRFTEEGDIMRLEIEEAMIKQRNIVPLFMEDFDFRDATQHLIGDLQNLPKYNGLEVPVKFFDYAMQTLITKHLEQDVNTIVHPASAKAKNYAKEQQIIATAQPIVTEDDLTAQEYYNRGFDKDDNGDIYGAIADYTYAIELKPDYTSAYYNRGILKSDYLSDYSGALADFNKSIELAPRKFSAYNNRGALKYKQGDYQGAKADWEQVLRINPNHTNAKDNLEIVKRKLGE